MTFLKIKTLLVGIVSTVGTTVATMSTSLNCTFFVYEPEVPEELKEENK